jgi:hypothetical protein
LHENNVTLYKYKNCLGKLKIFYNGPSIVVEALSYKLGGLGSIPDEVIGFFN